MSIQEYLHGKKQSVGLTKGENEVLTYLEDMDVRWFNHYPLECQ